MGRNPINIEGTDRFGRTIVLTIARLHIISVQGAIRKRVPIIVTRAPSGEPGDKVFGDEHILADLDISEEHFTDELLQLFPHGELNSIKDAPLPRYMGMVRALRALIEALEGVNDLKRHLAPLVILLRDLESLDESDSNGPSEAGEGFT